MTFRFLYLKNLEEQVKFNKIGNTEEKFREDRSKVPVISVEFMVLVRHSQLNKYLFNVDVKYQSRHLICLQ